MDTYNGIYYVRKGHSFVLTHELTHDMADACRRLRAMRHRCCILTLWQTYWRSC